MKRAMKMMLSVCTIDIYFQSIKEEKNGYASLNVNGAGKQRDWTPFICSDCLDT
jgi:hypothetical protein